MSKPWATTDSARVQSKVRSGIDRQPSGPSWVSSDSSSARVDQVADLAVDVPGEHPQPDADLRRREAGAGSVEHGVGEVLDQAAQLLVEVDDLDRGLAQDRVAEEADGLDGHAAESSERRQVRASADPPGCVRRRACAPSAGAGAPRAPARGRPSARGTRTTTRLSPSGTSTGPSTSADSGAASRVSASSTAPGSPVIVASRLAGGRWAASRSSVSRSAKPAGSQRTSACRAGWAGSPTATTRPPGRTSAAASAQRRSASSPGAQVDPGEQQPGVQQHDGGVPALGDRLGARRGHHDLRLRRRPWPARVAASWSAPGVVGKRPAQLLGGARVAERPARAARGDRTRRRPTPRRRCRTTGRPAGSPARSAPAAPGRPRSGPACGSARRPATRRSPAAASARAPGRSRARPHGQVHLARDPRAAGQRVARSCSLAPRPAPSPGGAPPPGRPAISLRPAGAEQVRPPRRCARTRRPARRAPSRSARSSSVSRVWGYGARGSACRSSPSSQITTSPRSWTGAKRPRGCRPRSAGRRG